MARKPAQACVPESKIGRLPAGSIVLDTANINPAERVVGAVSTGSSWQISRRKLDGAKRYC